MRILIKFPTRERPDKFFKAIENISDNIRTKDYMVLVSLDVDDASMKKEGMKSFIKSHPEIRAVWGTSEGKINAVNRDIWQIKESFDLLLVHSDDMWFTKKDFDDDIFEAFEGFNGLVHFPDGHQNENMITYPMMHRDYYKKFGYVYHPDYWSVYADNEQMKVAQALGKYKYVNKNILIHKHPIWGYGKADHLLKRNEEKTAYQRDGLLFAQREAINFEL